MSVMKLLGQSAHQRGAFGVQKIRFFLLVESDFGQQYLGQLHLQLQCPMHTLYMKGVGMLGIILILGPYQTTLVTNVWPNLTLVGQKLSGQSAQQRRGGEDFGVEKNSFFLLVASNYGQ